MRREMMEYREIIKKNIDYDFLCQSIPYELNRLDEIVALLVETCSATKAQLRIGGENYPVDLVRERFLQLNRDHIKFVFRSLRENTSRVRNIKQYLLTTLYNAPTTIDNYYSALVQHDLYHNSIHSE